MALLIVDMLSVLPSELRLQIYSYLFSTEDEGLIVLRTTRRGDWAGDMGLPAYAILLQDPQYDSSRNRRCIRDTWPDPIEEAFHKGDNRPYSYCVKLINCGLALQWTGPYQRRLNGTHSEHTNEMITRVIYEYTGQVRNRKQISSHIQNLRRIGSRMPEAPERLKQQISRATAELQDVDTEDTAKTNRILGQIQNASFVLARRCDEMRYNTLLLLCLNEGVGRVAKRPEHHGSHGSGQKMSCRMAQLIHYSRRSRTLRLRMTTSCHFNPYDR